MSNDKGPPAYIKNKAREMQKHISVYQPEYERLGMVPAQAGIPLMGGHAQPKLKRTEETTAPFVVSRGNQRGKENSPPPQVNVSVGSHSDITWASVDGEVIDPHGKFTNEYDDKVIDNNDDVDVDALQVVGAPVNNSEPAEKKEKAEVQPGEYVLLFRGKTVLSGVSGKDISEKIESIIYNPKFTDIDPDDFIVFKRVELHIGVVIKE